MNSTLWSQKPQQTEEIVCSSMAWYNEYSQAHGSRPKMPSSQSRSRWSPPIRGIKLNVDGAYLPNESEGGVGSILRNTHGRALAAFAHHVSFVSSAKHVELLAIKAALE
ncbi:hypothetical protein ACLB2K_012014 [Fragaria x ananassa]